jgi:hypothetical protein
MHMRLLAIGTRGDVQSYVALGLDDRGMRERTAALSKRIRTEDGVGRVVEGVERAVNPR